MKKQKAKCPICPVVCPDWADDAVFKLMTNPCSHFEAEKGIGCAHCVTDLVRVAYKRGFKAASGG